MKKNSESTKTAIKLFKQFLITNNALEGYLAGLAAVKETPGLNFSKKRKVGAPKEFIFCAFSWNQTKEGREYWDDLDRRWLKVCDAINL